MDLSLFIGWLIPHVARYIGDHTFLHLSHPISMSPAPCLPLKEVCAPSLPSLPNSFFPNLYQVRQHFEGCVITFYRNPDWQNSKQRLHNPLHLATLKAVHFFHFFHTMCQFILSFVGLIVWCCPVPCPWATIGWHFRGHHLQHAWCQSISLVKVPSLNSDLSSLMVVEWNWYPNKMRRVGGEGELAIWGWSEREKPRDSMKFWVLYDDSHRRLRGLHRRRNNLCSRKNIVLQNICFSPKSSMMFYWWTF